MKIEYRIALVLVVIGLLCYGTALMTLQDSSGYHPAPYHTPIFEQVTQ